MLLQHCYNISHIETALQQQPYCSQIWQVDCRFFTIFLKLKTLWPLFMGGIQLSQGLRHLEEAVYFLSLSSQKSLVLLSLILTVYSYQKSFSSEY